MTDTIDDEFGSPQYERKQFFQNFKMKAPEGDETTVFEARIIPPIKSCKATREWTVFAGQHFGYKGRDDKDSTKARHKPFKCIQKKSKDKHITVACAACTEIDRVKKLKERAEREAEDAGKSKEEIKALVQHHSDWLRAHNCDKKFRMNVMTPDGTFGCLALSYTCKTEQLDPVLDRLRKELEVDPMDPNRGVYLLFKRKKGVGFKVVDSVEISTIKEKTGEGEFTSKLKFAPLTADQKKAAIEILPDLHLMMTDLTSEQISRIVSSKGDLDVVDAVFKEVKIERDAKNGKEPAKEAPKASPKPTPKVDVADTKPSDPKPAAKEEPAKAKPAEAPKVEKPRELTAKEKLQAQLAEMEAAEKAAAIESTVVEQKPEEKAAAKSELENDDDFLAKYGGGMDEEDGDEP